MGGGVGREGARHWAAQRGRGLERKRERDRERERERGEGEREREEKREGQRATGNLAAQREDITVLSLSAT